MGRALESVHNRAKQVGQSKPRLSQPLSIVTSGSNRVEEFFSSVDVI
jgi:hypothetical protein